MRTATSFGFYSASYYDLTLHVGDKVALWAGDCREALRHIASNSVDSVVTDPPYALVSIAKRFGKPGAAPAQHGRDGLYARAAAGFMGQAWDTGEVAFASEFWGDMLRILKPGGHVAAFGGTRTYHRLACAIEDAGFEIRDQLAWMYGTGFPKSHNQGDGRGTALKPAHEPIALARKPLERGMTVAENLAYWGTGALNIDGCRVETDDVWKPSTRGASDSIGTFKTGTRTTEQNALGRWPANVVHDGSDEVVVAFPQGAHRFFYSAKAGRRDRCGSKHPTVKPVVLMQWLTRLITPPGGVVLDPFAGSGTTGEAAFLEGYRAVLCEREAEYVGDIGRRLATMGVEEPEALAA